MSIKKVSFYLFILFIGVAIGYFIKSLNLETAAESFEEKKSQHLANESSLNKSNIPSKVFEVLDHIKTEGTAPKGYVGGRTFRNIEKLLPIYHKGIKIKYKEWDVNPKIPGKNRGKERLVTGDDGSSYFTNDHYASFIKIE
jgi:ribonuclease T1